MKIVMTGTREWRDAEKVKAAAVYIQELAKDEPVTVMHFATNVIDGMVCAVAKLSGFNVVEAAPNWTADGRAGLFRLAERVISNVDLVITFGEDKVTEHIAKTCNDRNIRILSVEAAKPTVEVIEL